MDRPLAASNAEVIERLCRLPPTAVAPGRTFRYDNAGYVLLAEALSRAWSRPPAELITELISEMRQGDNLVRILVVVQE